MDPRWKRLENLTEKYLLVTWNILTFLHLIMQFWSKYIKSGNPEKMTKKSIFQKVWRIFTNQNMSIMSKNLLVVLLRDNVIIRTFSLRGSNIKQIHTPETINFILLHSFYLIRTNRTGWSKKRTPHPGPRWKILQENWV